MRMRKFIVASMMISGLISTPFAATAQTSGEWDLGTVYMTANSYCPRNTLDASGQILAISQNTALFALLGTQYGGNGVSTFALPNLQGRVVKDQGQGLGLPAYVQGQIGGTESTNLTIAQMPAHTHTAVTTASATTTATGHVHFDPNPGTTNSPVRGTFAIGTTNAYSTADPGTNNMKAGTVTVDATTTVSPTTTIGITGGNQPVSLLNPYVTLRYCIVTQGIFPSRP